MLIIKNSSNTLLIVIFFWIVNEILQLTEGFNKFAFLNFLVLHLSALYGAIIFCFLIAYLNLNKILMITPIAIELFQSWISYRFIDYWDITFSLTGILLFFILFAKEKRINFKLLKNLFVRN